MRNPTASPTPALDANAEALQAALAAEHAAVYGYEVIGGQLGPDHGPTQAAYRAHRERRDALMARIGPAAVAAEAVYGLPFPVTNPRQARRLARVLERRCAAVYADVVARTTVSARMLAAQALTDCALRGLTWGAEPEPFPGLGDLR